MKMVAQFNWAKPKYDLEAPEIEEFVRALDAINLLAESSPGFIWRTKETDSKDPDREQPLGDEYIANFSMWETLEDLQNFVYKSGHTFYLKKRNEWFTPEKYSNVVWYTESSVLTIEECMKARQELLKNGPSSDFFPLGWKIRKTST